MTVAFESAPAGTDPGPMVKGLPDDRCQANHWGYLFKGHMIVDYGDRTEEIRAARPTTCCRATASRSSRTPTRSSSRAPTSSSRRSRQCGGTPAPRTVTRRPDGFVLERLGERHLGELEAIAHDAECCASRGCRIRRPAISRDVARAVPTGGGTAAARGSRRTGRAAGSSGSAWPRRSRRGARARARLRGRPGRAGPGVRGRSGARADALGVRRGRAQRIVLHVEVANAASLRVAERAGYTREGVMRSAHVKQGRRADTVLFSLLPSDRAGLRMGRGRALPAPGRAPVRRARARGRASARPRPARSRQARAPPDGHHERARRAPRPTRRRAPGGTRRAAPASCRRGPCSRC